MIATIGLTPLLFLALPLLPVAVPLFLILG